MHKNIMSASSYGHQTCMGGCVLYVTNMCVEPNVKNDAQKGFSQPFPDSFPLPQPILRYLAVDLSTSPYKLKYL